MAAALRYQRVYRAKEPMLIEWLARLSAALILLVVLGFKVWVSTSCTGLGYELAKEQQRFVQLDMKRREFELQRSVLLRTDSLFERAKNSSGLSKTRRDQAWKVFHDH